MKGSRIVVLVALLVALVMLVLASPLVALAAGAPEAMPPPQAPLTGLAVPLTGFLAMLFLAAVGERLSEYFIKPIILVVSEAITDPRLKKWADIAERFICAVPGGGMVILLQVDIFAFLGLTMPHPWGMIITAFVVGGGANLVHAFIKAIPDNSGEPLKATCVTYVAGDTHG
jgi:uncharacterized membrane protein